MLEDLELIRFLMNLLRDESLARVRPLMYDEDVRRELQVERQRGA
jgi:hypothetical protein